MGNRSRFVKPEVVRLDISDGDWIEIKRRLTLGEQKRLEGAGIGRATGFRQGADVEVAVDLEAAAMALLVTYLVDWSLRDEHDKPVSVTRSSVAALDPDDAEEIEQAISNHIQARDAEKKARTLTIRAAVTR